MVDLVFLQLTPTEVLVILAVSLLVLAARWQAIARPFDRFKSGPHR